MDIGVGNLTEDDSAVCTVIASVLAVGLDFSSSHGSARIVEDRKRNPSARTKSSSIPPPRGGRSSAPLLGGAQWSRPAKRFRFLPRGRRHGAAPSTPGQPAVARGVIPAAERLFLSSVGVHACFSLPIAVSSEGYSQRHAAGRHPAAAAFAPNAVPLFAVSLEDRPRDPPTFLVPPPAPVDLGIQVAAEPPLRPCSPALPRRKADAPRVGQRVAARSMVSHTAALANPIPAALHPMRARDDAAGFSSSGACARGIRVRARASPFSPEASARGISELYPVEAACTVS
ncbi:hypothetical protein HPB50_013986 [Hyalomma asiaticum]|uniref:Uncharacterized protein n=1 Tax=Hyalomma asiaticum TaxID=266040 RepID=A0ACB7S766_HYAAI|nr:hypothetical protein HPB50_013986 [Hyalomma asiaticum]